METRCNDSGTKPVGQIPLAGSDGDLLQATVKTPVKGEVRFQGIKEMAREAESRLLGEEAESEIGSPAGREEEEPRVSSSRADSAALAGDVSFRSFGASSSSSSSSLVSDVESYGGDGGFPWTQCEYEEIPSFRWIASPLRWWKTKKVSDLSRKNTIDARSISRGEEPTTPGEPSRVSEASKSLIHFDGHHVFTLEELLRANAETLGESTYWAMYKVSLENEDQVVVRRLRSVEAAIERTNWHPEVDVLGKIQHPNLLAPRAYHYNPKGYKFLVFDYMPKGSLSAFLHARGHDMPIDWMTRMNIAIGITRGLHYLHTQGNMVHGNLSSKNVLLDYHGNAKIADYGLSKLLTPAANSNLMETMLASRNHAPELSKLRRANTKTDIYSLGMIMLELLTGKSPWEADLQQWFTTIVKEDGSLDVFDQDLRGRRAEDLLNALTVALQCVRSSPDTRPDVLQVLHQLSEITA